MVATLEAPPYGSGTLPDLLPAVLGSLGVEAGGVGAGGVGAGGGLGLEPARRVCVLLVDGMGARLLEQVVDRAPELVPNLARLHKDGRTLRSGFPSTTAASVASLWTGTTPGQHGLVGLSVGIPGCDRLLNLLRWRDEVDPLEWQPAPTVFERAVAAGITATAVVPGAFSGSGLSRAAYRGAPMSPAQSAGEIVAATTRALAQGDRSLVYTYYGDLDATGHRGGCGSEAWELQLEHVDRLVGQLVDRLPGGAVLHVTADHGMVDLDLTQCVDVDSEPELRRGVRLLGGEVRARHVYAEPGAAADLCDTWRGRLAGVAEVCTRDEAVAAGWFGPVVRDEVLPRIGDVVVAATGLGGVLATVAEPRESALVGHHGSLTDAEQAVPLLTAHG